MFEVGCSPGGGGDDGDVVAGAAGPGVSGEVLAGLVPGPETASVLAGVPAGELDAFGVVELVAAWWRLAAWAQGEAGRAAAVLVEALAPVLPAAEGPAVGSSSRAARRVAGPEAVAAMEVAMRLGLSRAAATALVATGRAMSRGLGPVGEALLAGEVDYGKAQEFVTALSGVALPVALDVQDAVLPGAGATTRAQVGRDIAAALIAVDPADAAARHARARARRRVCRPRVLPEGMAGLYAVLPAVDATALDLVLDAAARTARTSGDPRTSDQLRADALATLAHTALTTATIGTCPDSHDSHDGHDGHDDATGEGQPTHREPAEDATSMVARVPRPRVPQGGFRLGRIGRRPAQIRITVPLGVLLGHDDPPPGGECTHHTATASRGVGVGGGGGGGGPDHRPGPVTESPPLPTASAAAASTQPGSPPGDHPGRADPLTPEPAPGPSAGPAVSSRVAVLERYGPVSPDVARALALGGTWTRLITDPTTGTIRDIGRTTYTPPAELAELVRTRDTTCIRPGCTVPAHACDLDHTIPYHHGGDTTAWNLTALCPTDHALKTTGTYHITRGPDETYDFHLPSGHTYRRHPSGTTTHLTGPKPEERAG